MKLLVSGFANYETFIKLSTILPRYAHLEGDKIELEQGQTEEQPMSLNDIFDNFIEETNNIYYHLKVAYQSHLLEWPKEGTMHSGGALLLTPIYADNFPFDPMPYNDIERFKKTYPDFLMETFHGKLIQAWNNCLDAIFFHCICSHFSGSRAFQELGENHSVRLNFTILEQQKFISKIKENALVGFKLTEYKERISCIKKAVDSNVDNKYFVDIYKHVLIRNAIQHNNSTLNDNFISKLGNNKAFKLLDINKKSVQCKADDKITLSFYEIEWFINKMQFVVTKWKEAEGRQ